MGTEEETPYRIPEYQPLEIFGRGDRNNMFFVITHRATEQETIEDFARVVVEDNPELFEAFRKVLSDGQ